MPSEQLPSADNDYAASSGAALSTAFWNAALTDIGARLRDAEAIRADFQDLIDAGTSQALAMITENVTPQLDAVDALIASLNADIAEAQDNIAAILSGGLDADNVTESATRVFITPAQKTSLASLITNYAALVAGANSLYDTLAEIGTAIAANTTAIAAIVPNVFVGVTGNAAVAAGKAYRIKAAATLTLPASPATGDTIRFVDGEIVATGVYPVISRNGNTIMGSASDLTIDTAGFDIMLWWNGTDWRLF